MTRDAPLDGERVEPPFAFTPPTGAPAAPLPNGISASTELLSSGLPSLMVRSASKRGIREELLPFNDTQNDSPSRKSTRIMSSRWTGVPPPLQVVLQSQSAGSPHAAK
jgi:hypothetical protein